MSSWSRLLTVLSAIVVLSLSAFARVAILPQESVAGAHEKYTMRIPNEKDAASVTRIEVEFPAGLDIYGFEPKQGWKVELKKDARGRFTGAVWTGNLGPHEFVEFGLLGINPKTASNLAWTLVQVYDNGAREEYGNAKESKLKAPVVALRPSGYSSLHLGK